MTKVNQSLSACYRAYAAALVMSAAAAPSQASLVLNSYTENSTSFEAVYAFTQDITPLDGETSGLGSWSATLNQTYTPAVELVSPAQYTFAWAGAHLDTPHLGELPLLLTDLGICSIDAGTLSGTFCDTTTQVPHLAGHHYDEYRFWLELDSGSGYAYLTGAHISEVPVPAAAWLFGSGLVGMVTLARRRAQPLSA